MAVTMRNYWVVQVAGIATAASLQSLMNTAVAGSWDLALKEQANYIMLSFEWTARFTIDGGTPTAAIGLQWAATTNASHLYRWETTVDKIMIIWNTIKINIQLGFKTP